MRIISEVGSALRRELQEQDESHHRQHDEGRQNQGKARVRCCQKSVARARAAAGMGIVRV